MRDLFCVLSVIGFLSCSSSHHDFNNVGVAHLDSIFVNQYEAGDSLRGTPYIFYNYRLKNNSDSAITLNIRRWRFENSGRDNAYLVFNEDTLELFFGAKTPNTISIPANDSIQIDLNPDPMDLMDLIEYKNVGKIPPINYLKEVATKSKICLNSEKINFCDNPITRKLSFRNPLDSTASIWK